MDTCPYSLQLSAYHDGELSEPQRTQLEQHLETACVPCQTELRQLRRLSSIFSASPVVHLSNAARDRLNKLAPQIRDVGVIRLAEWVTALAASVLVAVSTWMLVNRQHAQPRTEPLSTETMVLATSSYTDLPTDVRSDAQFDDWVTTNLAASGVHE